MKIHLKIMLILLLAIAIRFLALGSTPISLYWDETSILLEARSLVETGRDSQGASPLQTIFAGYGDFKLPVYIWMTAPFLAVFGANGWAVRLPAAIAGVLAVWLVWLIAREIRSFTWAKRLPTEWPEWSAIIFALGYASVHFSHVAFEAQLAVTLGLLTIWSVMKTQQSRWWLLLTGVSLPLTLLTYFSARITLPLVILVWLVVSFNHLAWRKQLSTAVLIIVFGLISGALLASSSLWSASQKYRLSSPSILDIHPFVLESNANLSRTGSSLVARAIYHRHWLQLRAGLSSLSTFLSPEYLSFNGDPNLRHGTGEHGLYDWLVTLAIILGIYYAFRHYPRVLFWLSCWWLAGLLPGLVPLTVPHTLRTLPSLVPMALLGGIGIAVTVTRLKSAKVRLTFQVAIIALMCLTAIRFMQFYVTEYRQKSAEAWQHGYQELSQYLIDQRLSTDQIYVRHPDDRFFVWLRAFWPSQQRPRLVRQGYGTIQIDNISLINPTCQQLKSGTMVVGSTTLVKQLIQECQLTTQPAKIAVPGNTEYVQIIVP